MSERVAANQSSIRNEATCRAAHQHQHLIADETTACLDAISNNQLALFFLKRLSLLAMYIVYAAFPSLLLLLLDPDDRMMQ